MPACSPTRGASIGRILPLALVVTPNLPEAEALTGMPVTTPEDMEEAARRIHAMGPRSVLVKGGHLKGDAVDVLWNGKALTTFSVPRVDSVNTHGTGCTYSAAIAAGLARGNVLRRGRPRGQGVRDPRHPGRLPGRARRGPTPALRHRVVRTRSAMAEELEHEDGKMSFLEHLGSSAPASSGASSRR